MNRITLSIVALALFSVLTQTVSAQGMRTTFFRFAPTLVNDVEQKTEIIDRLPEGVRYQPLPHSGVFALLTPPPELVVKNGRLVLTAAFKPANTFSYQEDILLVRIPQNIPDTLRLRMTGTGYRINREEKLDFGAVVIGDEAVLEVYARAGIAGLNKWQFNVNDLEKPFALQTLNEPDKRGDTLVFKFSFAPIKIGQYADTIRLTRTIDAKPVETIDVILTGSGIRFPIKDKVSFGSVLTADTVRKMRTFKTFGHTPRYRVEHLPEAPFAMILAADNTPIPKPPDSIVVGATFKPTVRGVFTDSLVLVRIGNSPTDVFDTIVVTFTGEAVTQPAKDFVEFVDLMVGDSVAKPAVITLPTPTVNTQFSYTVQQHDAGPASSVGTKADGNTVTIKFDCKPTSYAATQTQVFTLFRKLKNIVVDSTQLFVTTTMKRRPVHLTVWADSVSGRIGDTVEVPIRFSVDDNVNATVLLGRLMIRLSYNPTMFVPQQNQFLSTTVANDSAFAELIAQNLKVDAGSQRSVLGVVEGILTMGDADRCAIPLVVEKPDVDDGIELTVTTVAGSVAITNVWTYGNGTPRYVNPLQGMLTLDAQPNPVTSASTLVVTNVPAQQGSLIITDATGKLIANLTDQLRSGTTSWTLAKGSGSPLSLSPGSYYARLVVAGISVDQIYAVTRLIVVQ